MPMKARKALCKEYEQLPSYKRLVLLRTELDHLLTGHVEALDFRVPQVSPFCLLPRVDDSLTRAALELTSVRISLASGS
jgi:hypothetical protein